MAIKSLSTPKKILKLTPILAYVILNAFKWGVKFILTHNSINTDNSLIPANRRWMNEEQENCSFIHHAIFISHKAQKGGEGQETERCL